MNVLFLSPAFPDEMVLFSEGLASVGARVFGVGEQPAATLPRRCRDALAAYLQVPSLMDEDALVAAVVAEARDKGVRFDRVETLWEPLVEHAAALREALGAPGMSRERARAFRDKESMKQALDAAGVRTPRHARCRTAEEVTSAAERIGFPIIVKPVAGAGSADTHRCDDAAALAAVLPAIRHVAEVSVEEFIEGEEYTFDTICAGGRVLYFNHSWYRPRPLIQRTVEWVSPQTIALRDVQAPHLCAAREMGQAVLDALGFRDGFTHMEWFLKADGEVVFCEIGARPPGARSVDIMNFACDADLFRGWAAAICHGELGDALGPRGLQRRYNAAIVFKRARGEGRIARIDGLGPFLARHGRHVAAVNLLPVGAWRRNWKHTLLSDGHLIVRHPDLPTCVALADAVGTDVQLVAG